MKALGEASLDNRVRVPARGCRHEITVRLAGHVAHLEENRREPAVASMTEPHAERVEHIPEQAREAQDPDPPAFEIDARRREVAIYPRAQRRSVARTVIAVVEAEYVRAVDREKRQPSDQDVELSEIDQPRAHAVAERMRRRIAARVRDATEVQARLEAGRFYVHGRSTPNRRAT